MLEPEYALVRMRLQKQLAPRSLHHRGQTPRQRLLLWLLNRGFALFLQCKNVRYHQFLWAQETRLQVFARKIITLATLAANSAQNASGSHGSTRQSWGAKLRAPRVRALNIHK